MASRGRSRHRAEIASCGHSSRSHDDRTVRALRPARAPATSHALLVARERPGTPRPGSPLPRSPLPTPSLKITVDFPEPSPARRATGEPDRVRLVTGIYRSGFELWPHLLGDALELSGLIPERPQVDPPAPGRRIPAQELGAVSGWSHAHPLPELVRVAIE